MRTFKELMNLGPVAPGTRFSLAAVAIMPPDAPEEAQVFCAARGARIEAPVDIRPRDPVGHSSIQPWSAGSVFPAVLTRLEVNGEYVGHELIIGAFRDTYSSYDDAHSIAAWACRDGRIITERYALLLEDSGWGIAAVPHPVADA